MVKALWDLGGEVTKKTFAINGLFTDTEVFKKIVNLAKGTWRAGNHTAEAFFERLRMARNLKVIDDLTAEELAIAKRAWQEGKAAAEAEQRLRNLGFRNVTLKAGDGTAGWDVYHPFDAMLVAAGGPGEIVQVGHHAESNLPVYMVDFGVVVLGCLEEEITLAVEAGA